MMVKPLVWKWEVLDSIERGPVAVQVWLTDTLNNGLPDTASKTGMVALKLAELRFLLTWKVELNVEPTACSSTVCVQLSNWPIKMSAPELLLTVKPSRSTVVSTQPTTLSKKATADGPLNLNLATVAGAALAVEALVEKANATRNNRSTKR